MDNNLIGNTLLDLSIKMNMNEEKANEFLESFVNECVLPILEKVINEYGEKYELSIDAIDIDLGRITPQDVPDAIENKLRQKIESYIFDQEFSSFIQPEGSSYSKQANQSKFPLLKEYLAVGDIPWQEDVNSFETESLIIDFVKDYLVSKNQEDLKSKVFFFVDSLSAEEIIHFYELLTLIDTGKVEVSSFTSQDIETALSSLEDYIHNSLMSKHPDLEKVFSSRERAWSSYRKNSSHNGISYESVLDVQHDTSDAAGKDGNQFSDAMSEELQGPSSMIDEDQLSESIIDELLFGDVISGQKRKTDDESFDRCDINPIDQKEDYSDTDNPNDDIWMPSEEEGFIPSKRILVSDAGLVLLHPFIISLFKNLSLVTDVDSPLQSVDIFNRKKMEFVSYEAKVNAVHLLRELVGSDTPHFSHLLTLEKILCGFGPNYDLPLEWEPTDLEKQEITSLLDAVRSYWRTLQNSSNGSLQKAFLQRPGSVEFSEGNWIVRVEGNAMDILMEDLPWELSFIVLPWLDNPIIIDWQKG